MSNFYSRLFPDFILNLKMMKDKLSEAVFQLLDLCSWAPPGEQPTHEGVVAPRCECVQLFKFEAELWWKKEHKPSTKPFFNRKCVLE